MTPREWLKIHERSERKLRRVVAAELKRQQLAIAEALADFDEINTATLSTVFNVNTATDDLLVVVRPAISEFALLAANGIFQRAPAAAPDTTIKALGPDDFELPDSVLDAIEWSLDMLTQQDYWKNIQRVAYDSLVEIVSDGMISGLNGHAMRKAIAAALIDGNKARADAIARTETTMAWNSGHQAAFESLQDDGIELKKKWLAIVDGDTRETHTEANGQVVDVKDDFKVGESAAPFPGHWTLPAKERVRCRCTVVEVFDL